VRIRIALSTAVAVLVIPSILFTLFSSTPAAAARARHEAGTRHSEARIDPKLMSNSQAEKAAKLANFYNAITKQHEETYLQELAANSANAIPAAWVPTALCEEGGRDDPYAGYFGILAWDGFDGYPTAGSAPLSVQLAWEAAHGQGPPDAPGQCHGY
jgi:hypothetical protein